MSFEDRLSVALLALVFLGISAAGFAIGGSHPALNSMALGFGCALWHLAFRGT